MRVVHVVDSLERGGLERVVTDLAIEQHSRGHQVSVFSLLATDGFRTELESHGITVEIGAKQGAFDINVLRRLRAHVRRCAAEIVHTHSFVPNYYTAASLFGLRNAPAVVGTCHDMGTRLSNRKLRWMYQASLLRTERVAMVGRKVHERFVGAGWVPARRATVVLNGIPVARFAPSQERRNEARHRLALAENALVVGAVGRLVALKNHRLLIECMPALLARWPALQLVVIGGGPLEPDLRALVAERRLSDRVVLASQRPDVADLLPAFDVFAMPSRTEGVSIALLEACATGLPIVATRVGGNPEIVQHETTGLLVEADDVEGTSQSIARLLENAALRARLGAAALEWVSTNASIAALGQAYERLYREALGRSG